MPVPVSSNAVLLTLTDAGHAPEWVRLLPMGRSESTSGSFVVDAEALRLVLAWWERRGNDVVVDFEHQTLGGKYSSPDGTAPAAGWIREMEAREDGLWARIEWTARAAQMIVNKEYQYFSPVQLVDKLTRRVLALHSIGLTNDPAILGAQRLVNKAGFEEEDPMDRLKGLLGLPAESSEDQVLEAVKALVSFKADATEALELKAGTGTELKTQVLALRNTVASLPSADEFAELKRTLAKREAEGLVAQAVKDGKLAPAMVESATVLAMTDKGAFEQFVAAAPKVVPLDTVAAGGAPAKGQDGLDEAERLVCKSLGLTPEQFLKGKEV